MHKKINVKTLFNRNFTLRKKIRSKKLFCCWPAVYMKFY